MNHLDGLPAGYQFQGDTHHNGPEQDTDIVGIHQRSHRIGHHVRQQMGEHIGERTGGSLIEHIAQLQGDGKEETAYHSTQRCQKGA